MNKNTDLESKLAAIATAVEALAQSYQGDSLALLAVLRRLEALHREIREGLFHASLPDNRHGLDELLKDIEAEGGWPYIERMRLQALLVNLLGEDAQNTDTMPEELAPTDPEATSEETTIDE